MSSITDLLNKTREATQRASQNAEKAATEKPKGTMRAPGFIGKQAGNQALTLELKQLREKQGMSIELDVSQIKVDSSRKRHLSDEKFQELVARVESEGVIIPIIVEIDEDGTPWCIAGHHRLESTIKAGKDKIPAVIRQYDSDLDRDMAVYTSNQNVPLSSYEQYHFLKQFQTNHGYTQKQLKEISGLSEGFISDILSIGKLDESLVTVLAESGLFVPQKVLANLRDFALDNGDKPEQLHALFKDFLLNNEGKSLPACIAKHFPAEPKPKPLVEKVSITADGKDVGSLRIEKRKIQFSCSEDIPDELADKIQNLIQSHFK